MSGHVTAGLFNSSLDGVARAHFKRGTARSIAGDLECSLDDSVNSALEAFLIAPRVVFKIAGENAVLALLMSILGQKRVQGLLEEGSVEFVLWPAQSSDMVAVGTTDISALKRGDPEESCKAGLALTKALKPADQRRMMWLALNRTKLAAEEPQDEAWRTAQILLGRDKAGEMPGDSAADETLAAGNRAISTLASSLFEAAVLIENGLDLYEAGDTWRVMTAIPSKFEYSAGSLKAAEHILRSAKLPSVRELLKAKLLVPEDVVKLRNNSATKNFREWLWGLSGSAEPLQANDLYAALLATASSQATLERSWFRAATISCVSLPDGYPTEAISPMDTSGREGLSYLDALTEAMRSGRQPRRFSYLE